MFFPEKKNIVEVPEDQLTVHERQIVKTIRNMPIETHIADSGRPRRYDGPLVWRIPNGLNFRDIANYGPCDFPTNCIPLLENDHPSPAAYVVFLPRFLLGCRDRPFKRQLDTIQSYRDQYRLPKNLFRSAGSAGVVGALILNHFLRTGEAIPRDFNWALTDSSHNGSRLKLSIMAVKGGLSFNLDHTNNDTHNAVGTFPFTVLREL